MCEFHWQASKLLHEGSHAIDLSELQTIEYRYKGIIDKAHLQYPNIPSEMIAALILMESHGHINATSPKGAEGLMQLMPGTAAELGVTDSYDPVQNVIGGTHYMSNLLVRYHGDVDKSLAAYNNGPSRIDRTGLLNLPTETKNYLTEYHNIAGE